MKNIKEVYYDEEEFNGVYGESIKNKKSKKYKLALALIISLVMLISGLMAVNINMSKTAKKNSIIDIQREHHGQSNVLVFYFGNAGYYFNVEPLVKIKDKIINFKF